MSCLGKFKNEGLCGAAPKNEFPKTTNKIKKKNNCLK